MLWAEAAANDVVGVSVGSAVVRSGRTLSAMVVMAVNSIMIISHQHLIGLGWCRGMG